jgi:hypothetical protein
MLQHTKALFPRFSKLAPQFELESVLEPASKEEVALIEHDAGLPLPDSYKRLLLCARGFWLMGGAIQFGLEHPFVHTFELLEHLSPEQQAIVRQRGGVWPPPTNGMLCFAEFAMEADGDQVLFDTRNGLQHGEYPVVYYSHALATPKTRLLASSFTEFMESFLEYGAFGDDEA